MSSNSRRISFAKIREEHRKQKRKKKLQLILTISIVGVVLIAGAVFVFFTDKNKQPTPVESAVSPTTEHTGSIRLNIDTPGATGNIEGIVIPMGLEISLPARKYTLVVSAEGYTSYTQSVEIFIGNTTEIQGALVDSVAPDVALAVSPSIATSGDTVQVAFHLSDAGSRLASVHLVLDGARFFDEDLMAQNKYDYTLPLAGLTAGLHQVELRVIDVMGNTSKAEAWVEIREKTLDINGVILPIPKAD